MKKVLYFASVLFCAALFSCEKEDIGGTETESMAGDWYVTVEAVDENGNVVTSHTTNLVPFIVTDKNLNIENVNKLSDIAPFILNYMNLNLPDEMK